MKPIVADTSPLNYLIQIRQAEILERVFGAVIVPTEVIVELRNPGAPALVKKWAANPPQMARN